MVKIIFDFKRLSFKQKITISFLIVSIIPILIMGLISYNISKNVVTDLETQMTYDLMNNEIDKVSSILKDVKGVSASLLSNSYIQEILGGDDTGKKEITPIIYNKLSDITADIHNNRDFLSSISIYGKNGIAYKSKGYYSTIYNDYRSCKDFMMNKNIHGLNVLYGTELLNFTDSEYYNILSFQIIRDIISLDELGVIVLSINENYLCNIYKSSESNSFIVDKQGKIISSISKKDIGKNINTQSYLAKIQKTDLKTGSFIKEVDGENFLIFYSKVKGIDWYLINLVSYKSLLKGSYAIRDLSIITIIIFIAVSFMLTFYIIKGLTNPLIKLKNLMKKVEEGNMDVQFTTQNNDEISFLGDSFNKMIKNIKEYIKEIEKQQKLKKESEIKLLQAQINPHFLYNTLDSLRCVIKEGNLHKSEEIVKAFSKFFKISLSKGAMLISINQEIDHILSYIAIQNYCYKKKINCIIDINPDIMNYIIIKLTFQPIVENSVIHGFKNYQDNGEIKISAIGDAGNGTIIITIEDNGMGIMEDRVRKLNESLQSDKSDDLNKPFGINNVNERLKNIFGNNYGLRIESEFGLYTKVIITIPKIKTKQELIMGDTDNV